MEACASNAISARHEDPIRFLEIDHVQLAMPQGAEDVARRFYGSVLGFSEVPKPAILAVRGGAWFESGSVRLHLGVEADFRPARKAHPALAVDNLRELVQRLEEAHWSFSPGETLESGARIFVDDPFGNRLEFLERA
jgi:catechol 2,3-dioxygenase-like lactoylglutathione lyase family enzyme